MTAIAKFVGSPEQPRWVIRELPAADKVVVTDVQRRTQILQSISRMTIKPGTLSVEKDGITQSFDNALMFDIDDLTVQVPDGVETNPPHPTEVAQGKTKKLVLCITYPPSTTPSPEIPPTPGLKTLLTFNVSTAISKNNPSAINETHNLSNSDSQLNVPVNIAYAQQDLDDAKEDRTITTDEQARVRVREELLQAALTAFRQAQENGLVDASGEVVSLATETETSNVITGIRKDLQAIYDLPDDIEWDKVSIPLPKRASGSANTPPTWRIGVEGLQLVRGVSVDVIEEDWEKTQNENAKRKLKTNREKKKSRILKEMSGRFQVKPGRIVTGQQIEADKAELEKLDTLIESVQNVNSCPQLPFVCPLANIIYPVERVKKSEANVSLKIGGGYGNEDKFTGRLSLEETNLLNLNENIALSAEAGNEVQKYSFDLTRNFTRSDFKPRFEIRDLGINAFVVSDKDKRFANLTQEEFDALEVGSTARVSFGYDSFALYQHSVKDCLTDEKRKRDRYGVLFSLSLNYRDVNIRDDDRLLTVSQIDRSLLPSARTQSTTFNASANVYYSYDFRRQSGKGVGSFEAGFETQWLRGFKAFGADYSFNLSRNRFHAELVFGKDTQQDFFLRYNQGFTYGTSGTPIFELARLGGPESLRGLEEGEIIGRKMTFSQFDFGVSALSLWGWLRGKGSSLTNCESCLDKQSQPQSPIDFSRLYLKTFFDLGRVSDNSSFLTNGNFTRSAKGYGVAVELRKMVADANGNRINLTIGYARSPESRLHKSGTMFVGVSYDF